MIASIAKADRALDLAITGVATALDEDDDDATGANTMASLMPMVPHGDVSVAPTMEAFMLVLQSLQTQNLSVSHGSHGGMGNGGRRRVST